MPVPHVALIALIVTGPVVVVVADLDADRARALMLYREHKDLEALPLLERVHAARPDDREVKEPLACALVNQSATLTDDEATTTLIRARRMLVELKEGGPLSDLGQVLLEGIPENGKRAGFSTRKEIDSAVREGEAAFSRREYDKARAFYERAIALDPKLYEAALFAGDTYFVQKRMEEALPWFERANAIDPNQSSAYRYAGDALVALGRQAEARDKYLRAVAVDPYMTRAWASLNRWANQNGGNLTLPKLLPDEPGAEGGKAHLGLYQARRDAWKASIFKTRFPDAPTYRHSLAEEADALHAVAEAVAADLKAGTLRDVDPALDLLLKIDREGLLEACILLTRPDAGIAADHAAYLAAHRDRLIAFLSTHVAPPVKAVEAK